MKKEKIIAIKPAWTILLLIAWLIVLGSLVQTVNDPVFLIGVILGIVAGISSLLLPVRNLKGMDTE